MNTWIFMKWMNTVNQPKGNSNSISCSVQFSSSVMSNSLRPHGLQHTRPPCPSPTPRAYSNSCPLSQWCHPTISSSVIPFSSCLQSFPASGSFPVNQFFSSGGQNIGVSASASILPMNIQDWFPVRWTGWISLQSKGFSRVFSMKFDFANLFWLVFSVYCTPNILSSWYFTLLHSVEYLTGLLSPFGSGCHTSVGLLASGFLLRLQPFLLRFIQRIFFAYTFESWFHTWLHLQIFSLL